MASTSLKMEAIDEDMSAVPTEKSAMVALIDAWHANRCLWDTDHYHYRNRDVRGEAYKALLKVFQKVKCGANMCDLRKKLENMRTSYKKEYKKVKKCYSEGQGVYVPKLWYYEHLLFLDEKEVNSIGWENGSEYASDDNDQDNSKSYDVDNDAPLSIEVCPEPTFHVTPDIKQEEAASSPPRKKIKIPPRKMKQDYYPDNSNSEVTSNDEDWDILGRAIGLQLKTMDYYQQTCAQKLISDVLFYGKLRKLCDSSTILLEPSHSSSSMGASNNNMPSPSQRWYQDNSTSSSPKP